MSGGRDDSAIRANAANAGIRIELPPDPGCEVWPENWTVMQVAVRMVSQLNVGFGGVVGFRYEALPVVFRALRVKPADQLDTIDALRVVEGEVVRLLNERR